MNVTLWITRDIVDGLWMYAGKQPPTFIQHLKYFVGINCFSLGEIKDEEALPEITSTLRNGDMAQLTVTKVDFFNKSNLPTEPTEAA